MAINRATIQNWMFLLSLREICYLRSGRNLNGTKSSRNLMYAVHEVTLSYRWRADTRPQPSWSWMSCCYSNVTSFPITADKSNYVVGSMTVTNQLSNHLPGLFLCSQITPRLVKQNSSTVGGISQGSISDGEGTMRMYFDLCPSQSVACRLVTESSEISFVPSIPGIYNITWTNRPSWGSDICVHLDSAML